MINQYFKKWSLKIKSRFQEYVAFFLHRLIQKKTQFQAYSSLKKRMLIMLTTMAVLFGAIFGFQAFKSHMIQKYMSANQSPPVTVSVQRVAYQAWQPQIRASGSLRAMQGVNVTSEVAGLVRKIRFKSGDDVNQNDMLVELNADADVAHLNSLIALAELAEITYIRDKEQYDVKAVSKSAVDASFADFKSKQAQVAEQTDIVSKKTIRAPFKGRLGISAINEGQYLNPGDKIVTLQYLDPIYVDFYIPQQNLVKMATGKTVMVKVDCYPEKVFTGIITAIDPKVDLDTRNVYVEATLTNHQHELLPGMFVSVEVYTGDSEQYLTLPQSAISYNPYGEVVYIVTEKTEENKKENKIKTVSQAFVTIGETRGDQVVILKGLKMGDRVVTSGQQKLKNGSQIIINNSVLLPNHSNPLPTEE